MLSNTQKRSQQAPESHETQKRPMRSPPISDEGIAEAGDHSIGRRAAINSAAFFCAQIVNKVSTFLAFILVSNFLVPAVFGFYIIVLTVREIVNGLASFGLDQVLVRALAQSGSPAERKRHLHDAVMLKLVLSIGAACVAVIIVKLLHFSTAIILGTLVVMVDLLLLNLSTSLTSFYRAALRSTPATVIQAASRVSYLSLLVLGIGLHASWLVLLFPLVIADGLLCLLLLVNLRASVSQVVPLPESRWRTMLRQSIPLGLSGIAILLYTRLDTLLISQLRSSVEVALYSIAYKLTEMPLVLATSIEASVLPVISALWISASRSERIGATAHNAMRLTYALALPIGVVLTFFGQEIIAILYHGHAAEYSKVVPSLAVMGWAMVAMSSNIIAASLLTGMQQQRVLVPIAIINLLINVGLNLWAIPRFGYFGSAVVTTVTEGFNTFAQITVMTLLLRDGRIAKLAIVATLMGTLSLGVFFNVYHTFPPLSVKIAAMICLMALLFVFKIITASDLRCVRGIAERFLPGWPPFPMHMRAPPAVLDKES